MIRSEEPSDRYSIIESVLEMMFWFDSLTPRGLPVDPEVNIRAARSSWPTSGKPTDSGSTLTSAVKLVTSTWLGSATGASETSLDAPHWSDSRRATRDSAKTHAGSVRSKI